MPQAMSKAALREQLSAGYQQYSAHYEVLLYAEDAATRDALKKSLKPGKKPPNLKEQEWREYLEAVENGTYTPLSHEPMQARKRSTSLRW